MSHKLLTAKISLSLMLIASVTLPAGTGDWPMWRYDAGRSNVTPHALPERLSVEWVRQLPAARPAWPGSQPKLQYDAHPQPIVVDGTLLIGSSVTDCLTAYDVQSGAEVWRCYTEGPIRFAPVAHAGRVYVASDDGHLYCLDLKTGDVIRRVAGGPAQRLILGNERLISSWPIRGGPVLHDGVVYFTAGIWPFMGIFIHAVDAETGETLWTNSDTGSAWVVHPHNAHSFGSIVPQGYLAMAGDRVIVPGGRSLPAVFDRRTGRLDHFQFGGKQSGGWNVAANDLFYVVGGEAFDLSGGRRIGAVNAELLTGELVANDTKVMQLGDAIQHIESVDRKGKKTVEFKVPVSSPRLAVTKGWEIQLMAGNRIFASSGNRIGAFPADREISATPDWSAELDAPVGAMIAAADRLFVVDARSKLYAFSEPPTVAADPTPDREPAALKDSELARSILAASDHYGYAVVIGLEEDSLVEQLVAGSKLHVVAIDPRADVVDRFRRRMDAAGLYGTRVAARVGSFRSLNLPPYVARLIVCRDRELLVGPEGIERVFQALRPYGGVAVWETGSAEAQIEQTVAAAELPQARLGSAGPLTVLSREGSLPGAGSWTHQYGNSANTVVSEDTLVKAPLGVLWFGGPANDEILPRHGHGPTPQVAGGRLVIEGPDLLRCIDVYTGSLLWERRLPGLGTYYNTVKHFAGAGEIGSNYVTVDDAVYVVYGNDLLALDPDTGSTVRTFTSPELEAGTWGFLAVDGDRLIATRSPVRLTDAELHGPLPVARSLSDTMERSKYSVASRQLVVFDRHSGERLWSRGAEYSFRHNCIAAAVGRLFCIDGMTEPQLDLLRRRGLAAQPARLLALDAQTGETLWSTDDRVFGTFLNYSEKRDLLIEAGSAYRDRAPDEINRGMVARRGMTGELVWEKRSQKHNGPCLLLDDRIITNGGGGFDLDLLSGEPLGWSYQRMYGCNTVVGSPNLLTFRSGAAGFFDLAGDSGTGNIGGFRSSCTSNLIIGDGVLSAPDYTRTCNCAYQNQSSLALVHMPEAEMWTFSSLDVPPQEFGANLGAPGDRRDDGGLLWFEVPTAGGKSPKLAVEVEGESLRSIRHHHSRMEPSAEAPPWVVSSCVTGVSKVVHRLPDSAATYRVRLYFSELENVKSGERVFDVAIDGETVIDDLDIVAEAGSSYRGMVRELRVEASSQVTISFTPKMGEACISGVEIHLD